MIRDDSLHYYDNPWQGGGAYGWGGDDNWYTGGGSETGLDAHGDPINPWDMWQGSGGGRHPKDPRGHGPDRMPGGGPIEPGPGNPFFPGYPGSPPVPFTPEPTYPLPQPAGPAGGGGGSGDIGNFTPTDWDPTSQPWWDPFASNEYTQDQLTRIAGTLQDRANTNIGRADESYTKYQAAWDDVMARLNAFSPEDTNPRWTIDELMAKAGGYLETYGEKWQDQSQNVGYLQWEDVRPLIDEANAAAMDEALSLRDNERQATLNTRLQSGFGPTDPAVQNAWRNRDDEVMRSHANYISQLIPDTYLRMEGENTQRMGIKNAFSNAYNQLAGSALDTTMRYGSSIYGSDVQAAGQRDQARLQAIDSMWHGVDSQQRAWEVAENFANIYLGDEAATWQNKFYQQMDQEQWEWFKQVEWPVQIEMIMEWIRGERHRREIEEEAWG